MTRIIAFTLAWSLASPFAFAEELKPIAPIARVLPPKGVDIGKEERKNLEARLPAPNADLWSHKSLRDIDKDLFADVEIYYKAVRWALDFDEFYDAKKDVAKAHALLDAAEDRMHFLMIRDPVWTKQRGLLVRGYRSDIDGSVQPYGLHIPKDLDLAKPVPLLVWLHGRGDKETDLHFIANREKSKGEFAPDWCITLHPYGRGTIGFKFAGEIDVLDAIGSVKKRYKIDEDRIALAGFSMGGAGAWHIGAHYADKFCVVHAGAGFVETAKYNKLKPEQYPAWYEQKLWGWYDVPNYTRNLFNVPVIAYSGENDKQKQAADLMAEAFKAEGRELRHIIGPGVEHKYEAKAKEQVLKEIKAAVDKGRDRWPKKVSLQTRTLRYASMHWASILALEQQWNESRLEAEIVDGNNIRVTTRNVRCFWLSKLSNLPNGDDVTMKIDDDTIDMNRERMQTLGAIFTKENGKWKWRLFSIASEEYDRLHKIGCSGSIDDAFMSPFLVVLPTGESKNSRVNRWVDFESRHFIERWRAVFRGDVRVKKDTEFTEKDAHQFNVVLWGDPTSNKVISRSVAGLSVKWDDHITFGAHHFESTDAIPVAIFPDVYWQKGEEGFSQGDRYVVLNSGPTFREGHDRTNSQQTPKLPDWAIIGLDKDPDALSPGTIKAAGFFDENWKVKKDEK